MFVSCASCSYACLRSGFCGSCSHNSVHRMLLLQVWMYLFVAVYFLAYLIPCKQPPVQGCTFCVLLAWLFRLLHAASPSVGLFPIMHAVLHAYRLYCLVILGLLVFIMFVLYTVYDVMSWLYSNSCVFIMCVWCTVSVCTWSYSH